MRKKLHILSLGMSALLGVMFLTPANVVRAGTEPSPFQPEINQLGAVANILHSADFRVAKSIAHPPEPCVPPEPCNSPDLNGAVNRLEAINKQVSSADDMVDAMISEVMGFEPTPFRAVDLIPALEVVRGAAETVFFTTERFMPPPDASVPAAYLDALGDVGHTAADIVDTAQGGINWINANAVCLGADNADSCLDLGCVWIIDAIDPYCTLDPAGL